MRIVGGNWRGQKLADIGAGDVAAHLRPSSDRLRETLFNIIRHEKYGYAPEGMRVLDLFAGSGALGFEALSRGASFVCFVDNGVTARALIRGNISQLGAAGDARLLRRDACVLGDAIEAPFNLVFMDPPYGKTLGENAIQSAINGGWLAENALIVWEEEHSPQAPPSLTQLDQRQIGKAYLGIYRRREQGKNTDGK